MADLLLAEHASQVEDFVRRGLGGRGEWLALGPSAMARLEELGLAYGIPEDFCDMGQLVAACQEGHGRVRLACDRLDDTLLREHQDLRTMGIRPFLFHIFGITIFTDAIRSQLFLLDAVLRALRPGTVWVHAGAPYTWDALLRFDNRESLWARTASLLAPPESTRLIPDVRRPAVQDRALRGEAGGDRLGVVRKAMSRSLFLSTLARSVKSGDMLAFAAVGRRRRASLLLVGGHEWTEVLAPLRQRGFRVLRTSGADLAEGSGPGKTGVTGAVPALLARDRELGDCFRERGVTFFPLVERRLEWIWSCFPEVCRRIHRRLKSAVRRYDIRGVLRSSSATGADHALNQTARHLGVPVFVWQHGFVGFGDRISELYDYTDLLTADAVFVYGKGPEEGFRARSEVSGPEIIPVGSVRLDRFFQRARAERPHAGRPPGAPGCRTLLYATTAYSENGWYLRTSAPFTDRLFYRDQEVLLRAMESWTQGAGGGVECVIKLHPAARSQDPPWVRQVEREGRIRIVRSGSSLQDLLLRADAVILDSPTTSVLEALCTQLPVFVLTRHWGFASELRQALGKRAACASGAAELTDLVEEWLTRGSYPAAVDDSGFLSAFGLPEGVEAVASQVAREVAARVRPR